MNLETQIADLKSKLYSGESPIGDWKILKIQEALLAGEEPPYDIVELRKARQAVRKEINKLQQELEA